MQLDLRMYYFILNSLCLSKSEPNKTITVLKSIADNIAGLIFILE